MMRESNFQFQSQCLGQVRMQREDKTEFLGVGEMGNNVATEQLIINRN